MIESVLMDKVSAKQMAAMLNGSEYSSVPTKEHEAIARESGLLIIMGASDDLVEFRGLFRDEDYISGSGWVHRFSKDGLPIQVIGCPEVEPTACPLYQQHVQAAYPNTVRSIWNDGDADQPAWTFETDIPHETFDIMEDGEVFCRGIVIAESDLK